MKILSAHEIREIAVRAQVDPRTVQKFILGEEELRPMARQRIIDAMEALGHVDE